MSNSQLSQDEGDELSPSGCGCNSPIHGLSRAGQGPQHHYRHLRNNPDNNYGRHIPRDYHGYTTAFNYSSSKSTPDAVTDTATRANCPSSSTSKPSGWQSGRGPPYSRVPTGRSRQPRQRSRRQRAPRCYHHPDWQCCTRSSSHDPWEHFKANSNSWLRDNRIANSGCPRTAAGSGGLSTGRIPWWQSTKHDG